MKRKLISLVLTMALVFTLLPASIASAATSERPDMPYLQKPVITKNAATLKWTNGDKSYDGYQVAYSKYPDFKKGTIYALVKGGGKASVKLTKVRTGHTYYAKVRAYKKNGDTTSYSKWSNDRELNMKLKRSYATKVKPNQTTKVLRDGSASQYFKFTAPKTDEYLFTVKKLPEDCYVRLEKSNGAYLGSFYDVDGYAKTLKKGQTVYIKFETEAYEDYDYEDENGDYDWTYLCPNMYTRTTLKVSNPDSIVLSTDDWGWNDVKMNLNTKNGLLKVTPRTVTDAAYGAHYRGGNFIEGVAAKVKKVTLGEGVTQVSYPAFRGCKNLKEVTLPETLGSIGSAFEERGKVTKLSVPPSVIFLTYKGEISPFSRVDKKITLYGKKGTEVQKFAKKNGNKFVSVIDSPVLKLKASSKDHKPYLEWKKVKGASKYEVWRKTGKNGTYVKMLTTTKTTVHNKSIKKSNTYYYKVKALHGSDPYKNSFFSKEKSITYKKR